MEITRIKMKIDMMTKNGDIKLKRRYKIKSRGRKGMTRGLKKREMKWNQESDKILKIRVEKSSEKKKKKKEKWKIKKRRETKGESQKRRRYGESKVKE